MSIFDRPPQRENQSNYKGIRNCSSVHCHCSSSQCISLTVPSADQSDRGRDLHFLLTVRKTNEPRKRFELAFGLTPQKSNKSTPKQVQQCAFAAGGRAASATLPRTPPKVSATVCALTAGGRERGGAYALSDLTPTTHPPGTSGLKCRPHREGQQTHRPGTNRICVVVRVAAGNCESA